MPPDGNVANLQLGDAGAANAGSAASGGVNRVLDHPNAPSARLHGERRREGQGDAFNRDHEKVLALQAARFEVLRLTCDQMIKQSAFVLATVAAALVRCTVTGGQ